MRARSPLFVAGFAGKAAGMLTCLSSAASCPRVGSEATSAPVQSGAVQRPDDGPQAPPVAIQVSVTPVKTPEWAMTGFTERFYTHPGFREYATQCIAGRDLDAGSVMQQPTVQGDPVNEWRMLLRKVSPICRGGYMICSARCPHRVVKPPDVSHTLRDL